MATSSTSDLPTARRYEAPRWWRSNIYGAILAGMAGASVLCVYAYIFLSHGNGFESMLYAGGLIANVILAIACLFPGNLIAWYPFAVEVEEGKGLIIFAPLKTVYIPLDNVKEIRWSWLTTGWRVRLNKRQRALTGFTIHAAFGAQGRDLARSIQEQIARRAGSG